MTVTEQSSNLVWYWDKKPIILKNMHYRQLNAIKKLLLKNDNPWYGHPRDYWLSAIRIIEKPLDRKATNEAVDIILNSRIKQAELTANTICNIIVKANNRNEVYQTS